jgi:hypothetical protein
MKLKNINDFLSKAKLNSQQRLLFDFKIGKIIIKCLLLVENRVLMFSAVNYSIGHSIFFDENGLFESLLPREFLM